MSFQLSLIPSEANLVQNASAWSAFAAEWSKSFIRGKSAFGSDLDNSKNIVGLAMGGTMGASMARALSLAPYASTSGFSALFVDRNGSMLGANMTTLAYDKKADSDTLFQYVSGSGPLPVEKKDEVACLPQVREFAGGIDSVPEGLKHATLTAVWRHEVYIAQDESNILGGNGMLLVDTTQGSVSIPIVEATEEHLAYYKAHLLKNGDCFRFQTPSNNFPLFKMEIGQNYVDRYLMRKEKGMYLEYHQEPHYHEPLNAEAGGAYILAREVGDAPPSADADGIERKIYHLTAFRVPFGTAVYTEPGAIHDDAATVGQWRVGYTIGVAEYSTVILFNSEMELLALDLEI